MIGKAAMNRKKGFKERARNGMAIQVVPLPSGSSL